MGDEGQPSEFAIVALGETRAANGALTGIRFTYRGRDFAAQRDHAADGWRVRSHGHDVGRVEHGELADAEDARAVARAIVARWWPLRS